MLIRYFLGYKKALTLCGGALVIALMKCRGTRTNLTIEMPDKDFHRFNALQFAAILEARNQEMYQAIRAELEGLAVTPPMLSQELK